MVVVVVVAVAFTVIIVVVITKLTTENTPLLCLHGRQYHCCHCYHHTWHDYLIRFPCRWLFSLTPSLRLATLLTSNENFVYRFPFHVAFQGTLTFPSLLHSVAFPSHILLSFFCSYSAAPTLLLSSRLSHRVHSQSSQHLSFSLISFPIPFVPLTICPHFLTALFLRHFDGVSSHLLPSGRLTQSPCTANTFT